MEPSVLDTVHMRPSFLVGLSNRALKTITLLITNLIQKTLLTPTGSPQPRLLRASNICNASRYVAWSLSVVFSVRTAPNIKLQIFILDQNWQFSDLNTTKIQKFRFFRFLKNFKKWALFIVNRIFDIQTINVNVESIELNFIHCDKWANCYKLWQICYFMLRYHHCSI